MFFNLRAIKKKCHFAQIPSLIAHIEQYVIMTLS